MYPLFRLNFVFLARPSVQTCLPTNLPTCLSAWLLAYPSTQLSTYLPTNLPTCSLACLPYTPPPFRPFAGPPARLPARSPACLLLRLLSEKVNTAHLSFFSSPPLFLPSLVRYAYDSSIPRRINVGPMIVYSRKMKETNRFLEKIETLSCARRIRGSFESDKLEANAYGGR